MILSIKIKYLLKIFIIIINAKLNKVKLSKYKHELRNKQNNVNNTILLPLKATKKCSELHHGLIQNNVTACIKDKYLSGF